MNGTYPQGFDHQELHDVSNAHPLVLIKDLSLSPCVQDHNNQASSLSFQRKFLRPPALARWNALTRGRADLCDLTSPIPSRLNTLKHGRERPPYKAAHVL